MFNCFSIFQFTYSRLYVFIIGGSTHVSAVCTLIVHSYPLSLSVPFAVRSAAHNIQTVTTPEIIDQIHELILEDRRISAKSMAEQLGISRERVGSIIHEDLDMRKLSAKWVPKCLKADQKHQRCQSSEQHLEFFRRHPNDLLSRLVTMDETWLYHYDLCSTFSSCLPPIYLISIVCGLHNFLILFISS